MSMGPTRETDPAGPTRGTDPSGPTAMTASPRQWPTWIAIFLVVFLVHLTSPNSSVADSLRTVPVADSMVHRRTISLDAYRTGGWGGPPPIETGYGVEEAQGHLYPRFPWTVSLFLVPVVVVVDGAAAAGIGQTVAERSIELNTDWEFQVAGMSYVVALAAVLVYAFSRLLLPIDDERRRRLLALAVTFVFAFGTSMWSTASRAAWQHGPSALFLAAATLVAVRSRTRPQPLLSLLLGVALAGAYVMRPTSVIPLLLFTLWVLVARFRQVPVYVAGLAVVLVPFVIVNLRAWGTALPPYFSAGRAEYHPGMFEALAGNLVSPTRGLFVFSPILLLSIVGVVMKLRGRTIDLLDLTMIASIGAHWVAISLAIDNAAIPLWWGGHSYGPRLFTDMIPFLLALSMPAVVWVATSRARALKLSAVALVAISVFFHWQGAYLRSSYCWNVIPENVDQHPDRLWEWDDPQFLRGVSELVSGPAQRTELRRGGVSGFGCPDLDT